MYKPPTNSNRVKSIKDKFENIEKNNQNNLNKTEIANNGFRCHLSANEKKLNSDLAKRNIKRTPAFRLDKNSEKSVPFQRGTYLSRSSNLLKPVSSALKIDCDKSEEIKKSCDVVDCAKPVLVKSKTLLDFNHIRNKFDKDSNPVDASINQRNSQAVDLSLLYTEPIPKSLRNKPVENVYANLNLQKTNIYNASTLKITEKGDNTKEIKTEKAGSLTDTLKIALKRPLPCGPAPQKPPRTFAYMSKDDNTVNLEKNKSFVHLTKTIEKELNLKQKIPVKKKADPKYMLNKLENAIRNNKLRSKKHTKQDILTTSGEDSDDSLLSKSKSSRLLPTPSPPFASNNTSLLAQALNLNCLTSFACHSTDYDTLKEPNSIFHTKLKREEPLYAEPFHFVKDMDRNNNGSSSGGASPCTEERSKAKRNSLYYLSNSVVNIDGNSGTRTTSNNCHMLSQNGDKNSDDPGKNAQLSENSSLSSFTSESATSSPMDEKSFETSINIKNLIDSFEGKQIYKKTSLSPDDPPDLDVRVDDLRTSLKRTIDSSFLFDESLTKDIMEEAENAIPNGRNSDDSMVDKFKTYVKKVSMFSQFRRKTSSHLFYCCLIVEWNQCEKQIKMKFPRDARIPHKIEDLCFPDGAEGPLDKSINAQCYSLVITDDKGERTFGYCRRVKPEGSVNCLPIAYCLLTKNKAPKFYRRVLIELESRHGLSEFMRESLLREFYFNKFPKPGESIKINLTKFKQQVKNYGNSDIDLVGQRNGVDFSNYKIVNNSGEYGSLTKVQNLNKECEDESEKDILLTLHHDAVYENSDLKPLHKLSNDILQKIFASLLLERKVILISCLLCKLSSCVESLQTILYPFSWPFTYIPILPSSLWELVESPSPIICGILSIDVINRHEIEHALVVDLDEGCILREEGDEDKILSSCMLKAWYKSIAIAKTIPVDHEAHSYHLSDAYLHMFIMALRTYRDHIVEKTFQRDTFIKSGKTRGIRRFLKWFTETTMFSIFIENVISGSQDFSLFDKKIAIYGSEDSNQILNKLLEWKK